ncbi:glial cell line-derived neurotrophic factor-like [Salmo trutta]|uniref:glial cell line-derived neurotrophic factor-like n=1 Tax=Salmo trutta TaxID=8032 RepID=UPI0011326338|nr:glial cell line-derived neurotrophic factor-like [Salmo trutta]
MIGELVRVGKDGKMWRRQELSTAQYHQRNWKIVLWVVAFLLTLVEGVFSEEDLKEAHTERLRAQERTTTAGAWLPDHYSEIHELGENRDGHGQASWPSLFENRSLEDDGKSYPGRWQRSPTDPDPSRRGARKKPKNSSRDCRMEKKEMRVRDLGLGFDSDEIVLFKYCMGTCSSSRKNYDLALKALTENGSISGRKVSAHPCCRPTRYETVSFMDAQTIWQTIKWLSAANCSCVG